MNKFSRGDFYFIIIQILNTFLILLGGGLLASFILLSSETKSVNSFIASIGFLSLVLITTSVFGYCSIKNSPCSTLIYLLFILVLTLTLVPLGMYILFDQEAIVKILIENMQDSKESIEKVENAINTNMDVTKIVLLLYSIIFVRIFLYSYRLLA
jgi:hypothetical protein